jgi:immune inhibitor A
MIKRSIIPLILFLCIIFNSSASFATLAVPGGENYRVSVRHYVPPKPGVYDLKPRGQGFFSSKSDRLPVIPMEKSAPAPEGPVTGTHKVLVLRVNFPGENFEQAHDDAYWEDLIFGSEENIKSLYNYLRENSYGQFLIAGDVYDTVITADNPITYYGLNSDRFIDVNVGELIREVISRADQNIDFSQYSNEEKVVDHLIIIHAGPGEEAGGGTYGANSIWSHYGRFGSPVTVDGVNIEDYIIVPDDGLLGVLAHEFGHDLGLPDLYSTADGLSVVGIWDVMDYGAWAGDPPGSSPTLLSAWSKALLGWVDVTNVAADQKLVIRPSENNSSGSVYRLWRDGDVHSQEYFLIEYRKKTGFDSALPGEGLLLWHIDDSIGSLEENNVNADWENPRVSLRQADGRIDLELGYNTGDAGDPFPGVAGKREFTAFTIPGSFSRDGKFSFVELTNISDPGDVMTADVYVKSQVPAEAPGELGIDREGSNIAFFWQPVLKAEAFDLQIAGDIYFKNIIVDAKDIYGTHYITNSITENGVYYWKVKAKNSLGVGPWSKISSFTNSTDAAVKDINLYPNPFSPKVYDKVIITYTMTDNATVGVFVYKGDEKLETVQNWVYSEANTLYQIDLESLTTYDDGKYTVLLCAYNEQGRWELGLDLIVDRVAELKELNVPSSISSETLTVKGKSEPGAIVKIFISGAEDIEITTPTKDDGTFEAHLALSKTGDYYVGVNAIDWAGNESYAGPFRVTRISSSGDTGGSGGSGGTGDAGGSSGGGGGGSATPVTEVPGLRVEQEVAPDKGGKIEAYGGNLVVDVPAGAIEEKVKIWVQIVKATDKPISEGQVPFSSVFNFGPEGIKFKKPVTIIIKYSEKDLNGFPPEKLSIFTWDENLQKWVSLGGRVDKEKQEVSTTVNHFSLYRLMGYSPTFDDIQNSWARHEIEMLASREIVDGVSRNTFDPGRNITRAEFIKLLVKGLGLETDVSGDSSFKDVKATDWFYASVETAYRYGLVRGDQDGLFNPGMNMSRQEMAAVLVRALGLEEEAGLMSDVEVESLLAFKDSSEISPWARKYVAAAVKHGLMKGNPDSTFRPKDVTRRDQAAAVIFRLLEQKGRI